MSSNIENSEDSSKRPSTGYELLRDPSINPGAAAATLSYLESSRSFGLFDKWTEVKCPDGTKARILKNPGDAFDIYAKEWTSKFSFVFDLFEKNKVNVTADVNNKIVKLFENLNYVDATLREMYKNAYLTFAATPWLESSQKEKQKMDKIVAGIGLSLIGLKMLIEGDGLKSLAKVSEEIIKLIDKLTSMVLAH